MALPTYPETLMEFDPMLEGGIGDSLVPILDRLETSNQPLFGLVKDALGTLQDRLEEIENALREKTPQLSRLSLAYADIAELVVAGEYGPGEFNVLSGGPDYSELGWLGARLSSTYTPISGVSATGSQFVFPTEHLLREGDRFFSEGSDSLAHNGFFKIDTIDSEFAVTVTSSLSGSATGATVTKLFAGGWLAQIALGGNNDYDAAPLFSTPQGQLIIGKNGSVELWDIDEAILGFLGIYDEDPIPVLSVGSSGGDIEVTTTTNHEFVTGDTVRFAGLRWVITVTGLTTFTLNDSTPGSHTDTEVIRYYAGLASQTASFGIIPGGSFGDAKFRALADGSLLIRDANIVINGTNVEGDDFVLTLTPEDVVLENLTQDQLIRLAAGYIQLENNSYSLGVASSSLNATELEFGVVGGGAWATGHADNGSEQGFVTVWNNSLGDQWYVDGMTGHTVLGSLELDVPLAIAEGGTGQSNAAAALTALGGTTLAAVQAWVASQGFLTQAVADTLYSPLGHGHSLSGSISIANRSITIPSTPNTQLHDHTASHTLVVV